MSGNKGRDGLRQGLDSVLALESELEETLAVFTAETKGYLEAPEIISQLHTLVTDHRDALQAHLQDLGVTNVPPIGPAIEAAFESAPEADGSTSGREALAVLSTVAAALSKAAIGYAVLHALAHRSYEIPTANLADEHRRNYLEASQAIHQAVGDVAVQKLQEGGHACRCECPACGPGICICWHVHVEAELTGSGVPTEGIAVRAPRAQSHAERSGLRHGDVILAVDGQEVRTYEDMRDGMGAHQAGEKATLRVRRGTGDPQEMVVTR